MTITKKETHSGKTDSLRKQAEKIARKKVAASPENINKMSPAKIKRMIHELRVQQIELDIQNEELRQSKAALEDSRARYFDLYDLAPVGYVTVNEKGLIIEANLTIATLLGIKKSNLAKQLLSRFISEEDQNIYYLQRKKLFDTDALQNCELRMLKKGGMAFWAGLTMTVVLAADGTPVCRIAIADITARKRADEALRESEELATELIATMPDIMVRMTLTGGILFINDVGLRLTEYRAEEMIGHNIFSFIAPEDLDKAARNAVLMLERKLGPQEYHLIMKDGRKVIFEVNAAVLHRKDGSPYEQALICRDITNRKQMEAENAALEAQNRQLQKSESLSRMAASIAHIFNNQLGVVIGNLELAMMDVPKGSSLHESITSAIKGAWKAAEMSGLMLTYLGQSLDKLEPLDLSYSCNKIMPILKAALPENVILETDFSSPGPVINTNTDYLQQILTNLLTNAWEAIGKDSGTISLSVKKVAFAEIPAAHRFPIDWQSQNNTCACLKVTDTGSGIADKDIEKIFDPFYTSKFTGRGMGLAVVLDIVKTHKGVLTVESKAKQGSTFRIFFPLSE